MTLSRDATIRLAASFNRAKPVWLDERDDPAMAVWRKMVQAVVASGIVPDRHLAEFADKASYQLPIKDHDRLHNAAS